MESLSENGPYATGELTISFMYVKGWCHVSVSAVSSIVVEYNAFSCLDSDLSLHSTEKKEFQTASKQKKIIPVVYT